jgi:hypothetical protein
MTKTSILIDEDRDELELCKKRSHNTRESNPEGLSAVKVFLIFGLALNFYARTVCLLRYILFVNNTKLTRRLDND